MSGVVLAAAVGVFSALLSLGALVGAVGSASARASAGTTLGGDIAVTVICALIALGGFWFAVHLEHQLRRHQPVAQAWGTASSAGVAPTTFPAGRGRRRRRRYSPGVVVVEALVFLGIFVGLVAGAVSTRYDAERSAFVQQHGAVRLATIVSVEDIYHSTRGGGYYTADVRMSFSPPVAGRSTTVAHYPGEIDAPAGTRYRVLVDPRDAAYAEFPGSPAAKSWDWVVFVIFAVVLGAIEVSMVASLVQYWRHRWLMRGAAGGRGGWPLSRSQSAPGWAGGAGAGGTGRTSALRRPGTGTRVGRGRSSPEPSAAALPELEGWPEQPSGPAGGAH